MSTIGPHHLRSMLAASTPGPWRVEAHPDVSLVRSTVGSRRVAECSDGDAALIAAAVNALPELLMEIDVKGAELARLRDDIASQCEEIDRLRADGARLRAALAEIAEGACDLRYIGSGGYVPDGKCSEVARAALAGEEATDA